MNRLSDSLHWQPALNAPGLVEAQRDIEQAIHIILRTPKGSDPHRPDFGAEVQRYLDYPIDQALPHLVRETTDAIRRWEPRCELVRVVPAMTESRITLRVVLRLADGVQFETELAL